MKITHRFVLNCFCLIIMFVATGVTHPSTADDLSLEDDKEIGALLDEIREDVSDTWWNKAWKFRRKITIEDPRLLNGNEAIYLQEPEPLLLFNTGRSSEGLADVRVVSGDGTVLPSGVTNFGRDDGSSHIWFMPPQRASLKALTVFVYYGNTAAKATGDELPEKGGVLGDPQFIQVGSEQLQQGAKPEGVAAPGSFFKNLVAIEAENFEADNKAQLDIFSSIHTEGASGAAVLSLKAGQNISAPITISTQVQIPSAGAWNIHVRYKAAEGKKKNAPFQVLLGSKEYSVGSTDAAGPVFRWQTIKTELPQGETKLSLKLTAAAAPDCILFTKDTRYRPDYRDINGPIFMRFKVQGAVEQPFYVDMFFYHTTFTVNGSQGNTSAYLLRDRVVLPKKTQRSTDNGGVILSSVVPSYAEALIKDPQNLLKAEEWSPWGESWPRGSWTWYSEIRLNAGGAAPRPLSDVKVAYEFATRPDASRVFRSGVEDSGVLNTIYIHMPDNLDLRTMQEQTMSYSDWGRQRYAIAESLGLKSGEGPKKIVFSTMASSRGKEEANLTLKALNYLGLNTVTFAAHSVGQELDKLIEANGITGVWSFDRTETLFDKYFYKKNLAKSTFGPAGEMEAKPLPITDLFPGSNYTQTVEKMLSEKADEHYRQITEARKKYAPWQLAHTRYNDQDDEIGPAISGHVINKHPLFKGLFIEFLKSNALEPGFFGVKSWENLNAIDYGDEFTKKELRLQQVIKDEEDAAKKLEKDTSVIDINTADKAASLDDDIEEETEPDKPVATKPKPEVATPVVQTPAQLQFEKRNYYWTQRFRSYFTAMWYRHHTNAIHKYYPAGIHTCVNLQASPVQGGRMWDGALNVFDLGRLNGFSALQVEDWHRSPVNVRFGMEIMRAAARKNNQETTALIVGGTPGQRVITDLMEGTRNFLFYAYGPINAGGPVWAEDKNTQRDISLAMRKVARAEEDILAAKNRPRSAALLVANTSEINAQYFSTKFDHERMAIYAALADQQIPVEIVGEEEISEDDALKKYKVLYVADPHVDTRAQKKIKEWVEGGGVLWTTYWGLSRNEYDSPSNLFDEVFGLKSRGEVLPYSTEGYNGKLPAGITVKVPKSEFFDGEDITGVHYNAIEAKAATPPDYKLSTGKALGFFSDDKPAIVQNKFGKGQAFLFGFPAGLSYSDHYHPHGYNFSYVAREAPATPRRAQLMTGIARAAGAEPHVQVDAHMLFTAVHDGPAQTVVFLVNQSGDINDVPMKITLPKPPTSAYVGNGQPLAYKAEGKEVTLNVKVPKDGYEILVFKF